ncbi:MAG: SpoIIE family protein phosphatase [Pseudoxanthomonas suwonensis]|nr:SpoIIE family protein phosphatase [Pseudoxanthomonas suwonensis]
MPLRSLATRQSLWLFGAATLVLLLVGSVVFWLANRAVLRDAETWNLRAAERGATALAEDMTRVAASAQIMRAFANEGGIRPNDERLLVKGILEANPLLSSFALIRLPDDGPVASPYWYRSPDGFVHRDLAEDVAGYRSQPWFIQGMSCVDGCWGERFRSDARGKELMNYSLPVHVDGAPVGLVSADLDIGWLQRHVTHASRDAVIAFIIDRRSGQIIAHPQPEYVGRSLNDAIVPDRGSTFEEASAVFTSEQPATVTAWSRLRDTRTRYFIASVPGSSWTLAMSVPEQSVLAGVRRIRWISGLLTLLSLSLLAIFVRQYLGRSLQPLTELDAATQKVATGDLDFVLPTPRHQDEVGRLSQSFSHMQHQLRAYLSQVETESARRERSRSELEIARLIQRSMLPDGSDVTGTEGIDCAGFLLPQNSVGGDFYSYVMNGDVLAFILGDVSDKGIPAALMTARALTLFDAAARHQRSPAALLSRLNADLHGKNDAYMFVTAICGTFDPARGILHLAGAGHEPPLLHDITGASRLDLETGPALGIDATAHYPESTVQLVPGQSLLLYTDGITEAMSTDGTMYGLQRLQEVLEKPMPPNSSGSIEHVFDDVRTFVGETPQHDDIALLNLGWRPPGQLHARQWTNQRDNIAPAMDWVEQHARLLGADDTLILELRLIAEELLANAIGHGYPDDRDGTIRIQLSRHDDLFRLVQRDTGIAFDPTSWEAEPGREPDSIGGHGIHLVRAMATRLRYHRLQGANAVEVLLQRASTPTPAGAVHES